MAVLSTEPFPTFLAGQAAASPPYVSTDLIPLVRGGVTYTVPPTVGANPTATAGAVAINGTATTFMRSDGAPAVAVVTANSAGLVPLPPDNTTTFLRGDATFAAPPAAPVGANPTATIGFSAVNGSAATFMRSDA